MRAEIPLEMYEKMIDTFVPSKCMNDFLKRGERIIDNEKLICGLILGSPVNLKTKKKWLDIMCAFFMDTAEGHIEKVRNEVNKAYLALERLAHEGIIYVIEDCWYDYDTHEQKAVFVSVCDSYESMMHIIKYNRAEELEDSDDGEVGETWFRVTLMKKNETSGEYESIYRFYEVNEEICFFEDMRFYGKNDLKKEREYRRENWPFDFTNAFSPTLGFNPLKPFKPGDILEVNYGPFAPKLYVVVLETDNDWNDDAYPTVFVRRKYVKDEYWDIASLQGTLPLVAYRCVDVLSPLFLIEKKEVLPPGRDNEILSQVSNLIKRDNLLGRTLWNEINEDGHNCYNGEDIRNWINYLQIKMQNDTNN